MSVTRFSGRRPEPARRDFLKVITSSLLAGAGLLGVGALLRYFDQTSGPQPETRFDLGPVSAYAIGSRTVLPDVPAVLVCGGDGLVALSLTCSHLGCTVEQTEQGFSCPCHGSRYDRQGGLLRGPAVQPLRHLRLEISSDDHLILHAD